MKYTGSVYSGNTVEGIGMAIPINEAKSLINDVLAGKGNVSASSESGNTSSSKDAITAENGPRLGVTVTNMNTSNYAVANGVLPIGAYVSAVESGSPAEKAGIAVGDIVVEVDGTVIKSTNQMISVLREKQAGDQVNVKVYRVEGGLDSVQDYSNIPQGEYIELTAELAILDNVKQ